MADLLLLSSRFRGTICNSDQGSHFSSPQFVQLLLDKQVAVSMDGRGRVLDNIYMERLWRTVKYEEVYFNDYETPQQTRRDCPTT